MGVSDSSVSELGSLSSMYGSGNIMSVWTEMIDNEDLIHSQYQLLAGHWPQAYNEVLLIVDKRNELSDFSLYSLGLKDPKEVSGQIRKLMLGEQVESTKVSFSYEELLNLTFRLALPGDYYQYNTSTRGYDSYLNNEDYMKKLLADSSRTTELKVVGIIKPDEEAVATSMQGAIAYTKQLTEFIVKESAKREIIQKQLTNPEIDVLTGAPFETPKEPSLEEIRALINAQFEAMSPEEKAQTSAMFFEMIQTDTSGQFAQLQQMIASAPDPSAISPSDLFAYLPNEMIQQLYKTYYPVQTTKNTYETNLILKKTKIGGKYGTNLTFNFSRFHNTDQQPVALAEQYGTMSGTEGYTSSFFKFGPDLLYQDIGLEIHRRLTKKWELTLGYNYITYNLEQLQGHVGMMHGHLVIGDLQWKVNKQHALRLELQHLYTREDKGSWVYGMLEYSISPRWFISVGDQWNYGNPNPTYKLHYYNIAGAFIWNTTRIALNFGKTQEGILCIGGVCRAVPASYGVGLSVTTSF